jgi:hypothetical protein
MSPGGFDEWAKGTGATAADVDALTRRPVPRPPAWPQLNPAALTGLAGRIVDTIAPYSEADPVAILMHTLISLGNLVGPGPHARVEKDPHPARLFGVLVGRTGKGRKGLSWSTPGRLSGRWTPPGPSRRAFRAARG